MLADRFKLRLHEEQREQSGYALTVARGGAKVTASKDTEQHSDSFRMNQTGLSGHGSPMQDFARYVGGKLGLVMVDQTGMQGLYDFQASWPEESDPIGDARVAIEKQLGLKIMGGRISVRTLVMDNAEKATEN